MPLTMVITLIGGLYFSTMRTPMAWAFSAPITRTASGIAMEKKASRLNWGATKVGATMSKTDLLQSSRPRNAAATRPRTSAPRTGGIFLVTFGSTK